MRPARGVLSHAPFRSADSSADGAGARARPRHFRGKAQERHFIKALEIYPPTFSINKVFGNWKHAGKGNRGRLVRGENASQNIFFSLFIAIGRKNETGCKFFFFLRTAIPFSFNFLFFYFLFLGFRFPGERERHCLGPGQIKEPGAPFHS